MTTTATTMKTCTKSQWCVFPCNHIFCRRFCCFCCCNFCSFIRFNILSSCCCRCFFFVVVVAFPLAQSFFVLNFYNSVHESRDIETMMTLFDEHTRNQPYKPYLMKIYVCAKIFVYFCAESKCVPNLIDLIASKYATKEKMNETCSSFFLALDSIPFVSLFSVNNIKVHGCMKGNNDYENKVFQLVFYIVMSLCSVYVYFVAYVRNKMKIKKKLPKWKSTPHDDDKMPRALKRWVKFNFCCCFCWWCRELYCSLFVTA